MMSNKNPFEIRLEVLKMAKDMSEQSYQMSIDTYWQTLNATAEAWNKSVEELLQHTQHMKPEMPAPQDIMKKAQELYTFISTKE
jgi:hypothetical protein